MSGEHRMDEGFPKEQKLLNEVPLIRQELSELGEPVGVEADDADNLIEPFDPDLISIEQRVVSMDALIRRLKQGSIRLNPNFQRNEVWDAERRSRLIESIILRIPLPMFYVAADAEGRWDVVDGLQRLSTIRNFVLGNEKKDKLCLKGLEFLGDRLNGYTYDQIVDDPANQRIINTIMETEMRFTVINPGTPEEVKRNVFKRLNTGGLPLTTQEIRHALYQGQVTDLVRMLAESESFREATDNSINDSRMAARELVLYFLAFAIFPRSIYKGNMDSWLSNAMRVINLMPSLDQIKLVKIFKEVESIPNIRIKNIEELSQRFEVAMKRGVVLFGKHAFRKSLPIKGQRRTPVNKALFETWGNILANLSFDDFKVLEKNKEKLIDVYNIILNGDGDLLELFNPFEDFNLSNDTDTEKRLQQLISIAFFVFGENISNISLSHIQSSLSDSNKEAYSTLQQLLSLVNGQLGKSLDVTISRNASDVDSVKRRYSYLDNLVNNIITYGK